jgi:hypothetical protein
VCASQIARWFSLRRIFTRQQLEGHIVVTIRIYIDESEGDAAYVAGGWACRSERWDCISEGWQAVLDSSPTISHFKINEAMGRKGPFEGWSEPSRDQKIEALARTIPHEDGFFGHGCYVARSDFERIRERVRRVYRSPYFFCVAAAMVLAVAGEYQIVGADKIDFVLDKSREAEHMRKIFYSDIKPRFQRLGECIPLDDKETNPLQAADLGAAALRQLYEPNPRPIPGIKVLNGVFAGNFELREKALENMLTTSLFKKKPIGPVTAL